MNTMCCLPAISHSKYVQSWHARARSIHEHMHIHFPGHYLFFFKGIIFVMGDSNFFILF